MSPRTHNPRYAFKHPSLKNQTQLRGRVSFAPTGSEAEDGQRLLSFALKWYAGARLALLAVGTGEL